MNSITPYSALALQMDCHAVNALSSRSDVDTAMMATLDRVDTMIRGSKAFIATFSGDPVKLVVLPEYFMTGFPMGESIAAWRDKACIARTALNMTAWVKSRVSMVCTCRVMPTRSTRIFRISIFKPASSSQIRVTWYCDTAA